MWRRRLAIRLLGYDPDKALETLRSERNSLHKRLQEGAQLVYTARQVLRRVHSVKEVEKCLEKQQFETRGEAEQAALALWYKDARVLDVYQCRVCRLYHHTTGKVPPTPVDTSGRMKASIGELLKAKE